VLVTATCLAGAQRSPTVDYQHSAAHRWLNKTVLESRPPNNMEFLDKWTPFTRVAQAAADALVSAQAVMARELVAELSNQQVRGRCLGA
jgi:hypothetical protein